MSPLGGYGENNYQFSIWIWIVFVTALITGKQEFFSCEHVCWINYIHGFNMIFLKNRAPSPKELLIFLLCSKNFRRKSQAYFYRFIHKSRSPPPWKYRVSNDHISTLYHISGLFYDNKQLCLQYVLTRKQIFNMCYRTWVENCQTLAPYMHLCIESSVHLSDYRHCGDPIHAPSLNTP